MPTTQRVIFTPVPMGFKLDPETIRVSVLVSPRLSGEERLGSYPDWLDWVTRRKQAGIAFTFECAGARMTVQADTERLREDLWRALFTEDTYVRPYKFDDYSDRFVASYSNRSALGLIRATYQAAGVAFATPPADGHPRERIAMARVRLRDLLKPYGVSWSPRESIGLRDHLIRQQERLRKATAEIGPAPSFVEAGLAADGQIVTGALDPSDQESFGPAQELVASEYQVFSHQPQGAPVTAESLDREHVLDFHQALSAIGAYPLLQRDLGLVFDVELPLDFVADTGVGVGEFAIVEVLTRWDDPAATFVPPTRTAYQHVPFGQRRLFAVATLGRPGFIGMLNLDKRWFGVAQIDIDGALHRTIRHALDLSRLPGESVPPTVDVFDPATALASLRSGGLSLFVDSRALRLLAAADRASKHNADLETGVPQREAFRIEDLTRGYRLDIWDSVTRQWHSLHRRNSTITVGKEGIRLDVEDEEGFFQAAATQAAPEADGTRANTDLHLHEAIVRWSGWSFSAPAVGTHLTRDGDPEKALPDAANPDPENAAVTPFKLTSTSVHVKGSLPRLRFGVGYRLRVRLVDLAGNGLRPDDEECDLLTPWLSMPRGEGEIPFLRFEPIAPPVVVVRDPAAISGRGSAAERLVIRTFNTDPSRDAAPADLTASDRHIAPPGVHVEMAERHGMFDDAAGRLVGSPAMWQLIKERDAGSFALQDVPGMVIDGVVQKVPVDAADQVAALPYLPDPLARSAALRDLPGTAGRTLGRVAPGAGPAEDVTYGEIADAQPRAGTATLVSFGGRDDWQQVLPFRLALADGPAAPRWDPAGRLLTVSLPKGSTHVVAMSACCDADDLKYLGVWAWLRDYVGFLGRKGTPIASAFWEPTEARDRLAHVLQLAEEGGHPMLTPPRLLTLISAVQQPIGRPAFRPLTAQLQLEFKEGGPTPTLLQTQPEAAPTEGTELAPLSAWRAFGGSDAFLVGALAVHGQSTAKVDLIATWTDPVDNLIDDPGEQTFSAAVDEIPLPDLRPRRFGWLDPVLYTSGDHRAVGWYVAEQDVVAFAPASTRLGLLPEGAYLWRDMVPRHRIGDTRHHVVAYSPVATSRYRDCFDPLNPDGTERDFTRTGDPVVVHVPASARPVAPEVRYVVPTFGWERAGGANQRRSIRTGGGLRVYVGRPWHSSGADELLGVTLASGPVDREAWKGLITQWGQDPIWQSASLPAFPGPRDFPDAVASEAGLPLDAIDPGTLSPRLADVAGHAVQWDKARKLYFCDLTVSTGTATYMPFVRLALARYQPHALIGAKLSRVVLADFAQLTPERALTVTADPFAPGTVRAMVSGPVPRGPVPEWLGMRLADRATEIVVSVQRRDASFDSDLGWAAAADFAVEEDPRDPLDPPPPDFILWSGTVHFPAAALTAGPVRLLVEEHELYLVDRAVPRSGPFEPPVLRPPVGRRLVYAETVLLDAALLAPPARAAASTEAY